MNNEDATIRSLQELKTLFDSGAITQEEYESLKKRIIFGTTETNPPQPGPGMVQPPITSSSPDVVRPLETKIIYPSSQPVTPEPPVTPPPIPEESYDDPETDIGVRPVKKTDWVLVSLAVVGALLLLSLLAYQFFNKPNSERLTSKSGPDTEEIFPTDTSGTTATEPTEPTVPAITQTDSTITAQPDTASSRQVPATQEPSAASGALPSEVFGQPASLLSDKNQIISKATEQLNAYYSDMQAAPFNATSYFAPQVERYYTLTNTTPAGIAENVNSYHFSEFLNGQTSIQEGSMEVINISDNGYELTYLENGSAFRKSKNQKQETKAAVRVKFNPDFKITFLRQEQLLENKFISE